MVEDRFREIFDGVAETLPPSLSKLRALHPRLCLNLHGGTRSAWLTALSGAQYRAGFQHYRLRAAYNVLIPRAQQILKVDRKVHTAEHLASAIFFLGAPSSEIPAAKLAAAVAPAILSPMRPPYAVIHPVAATPAKTWPAANFIAIANHLNAAGIQPIFVGSAQDDLTPFAAHRTIQGATLSEIKSLLSAAALFIGNDSGPAHMAAAFHLPAIVLFGASDPAIWAPWKTKSEVLTHPEGIAAIPPAQVAAAIDRMLRSADHRSAN